MAKLGVKHLVECSCVLPQLSKLPNPPSHEFIVFSIHDDSTDDFESSFVQCDNCGVVHKVVDICSSVILHGRDEMRSVIVIDDVKSGIPAAIVNVLEQHKVDLATWQQVAWVIESKSWGTPVILTSEYIDGSRQGKIMTIIGDTLHKISNFTNETVAG